MKITLKLALAIAAFALCSNVSAQNKIAHINMEELIVSMPEYESAMESLQKVAQELEEAIESMTVEFNRKLDEFQRNNESWSDLVRQSKNQELLQLQQRAQAFQEQAQESYQMEQGKLMQPVLEKANKAVENVAKEQGVDYVLSGNPQILIFKAVGTLDLLPAVKQHLGIK